MTLGIKTIKPQMTYLIMHRNTQILCIYNTAYAQTQAHLHQMSGFISKAGVRLTILLSVVGLL